MAWNSRAQAPVSDAHGHAYLIVQVLPPAAFTQQIRDSAAPYNLRPDVGGSPHASTFVPPPSLYLQPRRLRQPPRQHLRAATISLPTLG